MPHTYSQNLSAIAINQVIRHMNVLAELLSQPQEILKSIRRLVLRSLVLRKYHPFTQSLHSVLQRLINVENHSLRILPPHILIPMLQTNPHNPRRQHRNDRKRDARHPRLQEPRVVRAGPQIGRINTTHIAQGVAQRQRDCLLFWCLP